MTTGVSSLRGHILAAGNPMSFRSSVAVIGEQYTSPAVKLRVSPARQPSGFPETFAL